jgi:hypothetical protein
MNAAKVTQEITVNGTTATIRKLSGRHVERARESRQAQRLEAYRKLRTFQREFMDLAAPTVASAEPATTPAPETVPNPLEDFDPYVVIECGLVSVGTGEPVTPEFIADFAEDDVLTIAEAILRLSVPRLFLTKAEAEDAQKNASRPYSSH